MKRVTLVVLLLVTGCSKCTSVTSSSREATEGPSRPHPRVVSIVARDDHTCVVTDGAAARCWGSGRGGAIGDGKQDGDDGSPHDVKTPFAPAGLPPVAGLALRSLGTAAVGRDGSVWSWGHFHFFFGDGSSPPDAIASLVPLRRSFGGKIKELSFGFDHACALRDDGQVECFGRGREGQLGNGRLASSHRPELVRGVDRATHIAAGGGHTCAILRPRGEVTCWGLDPKGRPELPPDPAALERWREHDDPMPAPTPFGARPPKGSSPPLARPAPPPHPDTRRHMPGPRPAFDEMPRAIAGLEAAALIATGSRSGQGEEFTCVLLQSGTIECWGFNGLGQLGDGSRTDRATPKAVPGITDAVHLAASSYRACAVDRSGRVLCWGAPIDPNDQRPPPRSVEGLTDAVQVALGERHACAVRRDGDVWCWGANDHAQLGRGGEFGKPAPVIW